MLDISPQDIADLDDGHLRELVGRLCEAELRSLGLPASAVTWGGNQDARDGGIDVRVALPCSTSIEGFVPCHAVGFQVKKPDMPSSAICAEMRPGGTIRPAIRALAEQSGAYIIVSSSGSTSDSALRDRRDAMADAVCDVPGHDGLCLDFYDRTRLATWARGHPGIILWIREQLGRPQGWRPYGNWANRSECVTGNYLIDGVARVHTGRMEERRGLSALEGIERLRDLLCTPRSAVRLVGLSGVGKTRLVQALFDERINGHALDPSLAVYTDMGDDPNPQPVALASELIAKRTRAIIIVDNCSHDLHRRLSDICRAPESELSLITVEYDIREDQPEGTDVFELTSSSNELLEELIKNRFPEVSEIDARTIAQFSDGNAKIAIALASTVGRSDTIAGLNDEELFNRLFLQRHDHDRSLLCAAQVCALVYSFEGEKISGQDAELPKLATLIGQSVNDIFGHVAELFRRGLVQRRSGWRAILPHAIANRLAATALQNIPTQTIETHLVVDAPVRLLRSFARRLGYLHSSADAVALVEKWLGEGGLLDQLGSQNVTAHPPGLMSPVRA